VRDSLISASIKVIFLTSDKQQAKSSTYLKSLNIAVIETLFNKGALNI
jgi:hypothetical protein